MLTMKLQALAAGVVLAPADRLAGKLAKPVEIEKNATKPAAPVDSAKPTIPEGKKKAVGGKKRGVPDDSI